MPKSKTYEEFIEKFKPKLTTDDCATPPLIYEVVLGWACKEYGIDPSKVIRPFWPGQDYTAVDYPAGCVVLDNPPFSILSKICEWYLDRSIKFFLFAPALTALSGKNACMEMNHIICGAGIVYENGARVPTAFVTNLGDGETILQTAPELGRMVNEAIRQAQEETAKELPKYEYPDNVVTATMCQRYSNYGIDLKIKRSDCIRISQLDAQRESGKKIFGEGLLLSEKAAAEKAAAEKAAAEKGRAAAQVWQLSKRELDIVRGLG